jgi:hypothetical protein
MRLNSKVTWGLAWTGLAVVLAVPSADYLTGRLGGKDAAAAVLTSDVEPVKTAAITPADPLPVKTVTTVKTKNGISIVPPGGTLPAADPDEKLLSNGKGLPDYISDGTSPAKTETQVASIDPTPPTPFPAWARPKAAPVAAAPLVTAPAATTSPEPVVIVDDTTLTGSIAQPEQTGPVPPSPIVDDSANWDEETLRQYLQRRGILEGGDDRSTATVTERSTDYDPDGFYLNDGPNGDRMTRETRRQRLKRLFEESGDDPDSITLF